MDEYPVLARISKDILAIPASTIASESCFSAGRRVISEKRCRLAPQTVRALVCKKDWVRAEQRTQEEYEISRFTVYDEDGQEGTTDGSGGASTGTLDDDFSEEFETETE